VFYFHYVRHGVGGADNTAPVSVLMLVKVREGVWVSAPCRAKREVEVSLRAVSIAYRMVLNLIRLL
jgi:hypothetical protein